MQDNICDWIIIIDYLSVAAGECGAHFYILLGELPLTDQ